MAYYNHVEIISAIENLAVAYPSYCTRTILPEQSHEGNNIYALHIQVTASKPVVLLTGSVHAREWGGSEICISFAADLLEAYDTNTGLTYGGKHYNFLEVKALIENINWMIVPNVNPDGRKYSQEHNSLWRKNRNDDITPDGSCIGVDLNRNHDFLWDFENRFSPSASVNTSSDPCSTSQTFRGTSSHSESETRNIKWIMDNYPVSYYLDIHCSGELILYSWGNDENQSADSTMNFGNNAFDNSRGVAGDVAYKEYIPSNDQSNALSLANEMNNGIIGVRGKDYSVGQAFELYATSGAGDDYVIMARSM